MNRFVKPIIISASLVTLFGCVGSNAVTGKLMEFNVKAVDNRYARGGLNMLLAPAYGITVAADYIVFNSLEFWTGKNPINKNHTSLIARLIPTLMLTTNLMTA